MKKTYISPNSVSIQMGKALLSQTSTGVYAEEEITDTKKLLGRQGFFENDSDED